MSDKDKMKILILGLNYAPELVGIAVYTTGLAEYLARRGHDVHVIAGKPYYPAWEVAPDFRGGWRRLSTEGGVTIERVAHYVPAKPSGFKRLVHHLSFLVSSLLPTLLAARRMKADVVFAVAPSLIAAPVAWLAARLCGAKCWLHVQDFEVESAVATGLFSGGRLMRIAGWFESRIMKLFDRVSSISPAMCRRLAEKGISPEKIIEFRNWADIDTVRPLAGPSPFRQKWEINTSYVALYSGNIANKQGIEVVVDAARLLHGKRDLTFVVCGDGPNRSKLESMASGLDNIRFFELQPKAELGDLLGLATVHLLPQLESAADLVLPSKLANMLASGRPIVATVHPETGLAAEVDGCGLIVEPGSVNALVLAIERLIDDDYCREKFSKNARLRAQARWDRETLISNLENCLIAIIFGCL